MGRFDKSVTWPQNEVMHPMRQMPQGRRPLADTTPAAGRPTTPLDERKRRKERELQRETERRGPMSISFFDEPRKSPPPSFIRSIHDHDTRQKERQENRELSRSGGGSRSVPTLHAERRDDLGSGQQLAPGRSRSAVNRVSE